MINVREESLLRLSLITQVGNTSTFNSGLIKLITMVIYESDLYSLSLDDIRYQIGVNYELEFTNEEILNAINSKDYGIYSITEKREIRNGNIASSKNIQKYKLEDRIVNKLKDNEEKDLYNSIIDDFISSHEFTNFNSTEIKDILNKYLYSVFNSNKDTMLQLLKKGNSNLESIECFPNIKDEEKKLINEFLNWDNPIKNEFIFRTISYCIDYCMLTIRKDHSSFRSLFKGKVFYLDANIIFRMAGINNEERKVVTNSFINKCIENGIEIRYTNITYDEIRSTVNRQIQGLKDMVGGYKPVSTEHYRGFSKPSANIELIVKYDNWIKSKGGKNNNFMAFEKFIQKEIDNILIKFKKVDFLSYEVTDKKDFTSLCESLASYKSNKDANYTRASIKIDINNYLYVYNLRKLSKGSTFLDISDYIISADGNLCEWGKEVLPSAIPIAVLPSVWHSLLLKFKGRTDKDYKAFTLFLNLRYKVSDEGFDNRKPKLLSIVQHMDEPVNIKNLILDEISDNLTNKYSDISDEHEIVEKAKNEVIENEINRIYEDDGKKLIDKGIAKGVVQAIHKIAESNVSTIIKRRTRIKKVIDWTRLIVGCLLAITIFITVVLFGISAISSTFKSEIFGYDLLSWTNVVGIFSGGIVFFILNPIKSLIGQEGYETLITKEIEKLKKGFKDEV